MVATPATAAAAESDASEQRIHISRHDTTTEGWKRCEEWSGWNEEFEWAFIGAHDER